MENAMYLNKPKEKHAPQNVLQKAIHQIVNLYNQKQFSVVIEQAHTLTKQYPETFVVWIILGASYAQIGNLDRAIDSYQHALLIKPDYPEGYNNLGVVLKNKGKLEEAIQVFKKALSLKPDYLEVYNNMGNTLKDKGNIDEAIKAYDKAILLKPDYAEAYSNKGNALQVQGNFEESIEAYNKALSLKPDYIKVYINMGAALQGQGKLQEAIEVYKKALILKPDYAEAYINIGIVLHGQGKLKEALEACNKSISINPYYAEAYNYVGKILKDLDEIPTAINNFKKALEIRPDYESARVNKLFNQAYICDWDGVEEDQKLIPTIGVLDQHVIPGMMTAFEDVPERHRIRSELYAKNIIKQKTIPMPPIPNKKPKRLRIGYFSSDFRAHSVMYMFADIIEAHDRECFEIYGYSFGPNDDSEFRRKIINTFDVFHDVKEMSYQAIALLARQDKIDIAIDINGYTKLSRPNIFAYRAAPIQVHFWGSASTSGANFIDYFIAPDIGIPKEYSHHWCEPIIRLPFWYQARYANGYVSNSPITRKDMGLPEKGFVFCSFNNNYKLSRVEFDIWMRLLNNVQDSVLWIYESNKWVKKNLQHEACKRGVNADRLVFAEKVPHPEHLARLRLADIFIDTFNVNAGATAGDALWAGLPLVTKLGKGLTARCGGYLLASIEMHELITKNEQEYETLLLDLANNPQRLSKIREKLASNRLTTPLFNSELFTKHLEYGYNHAYQLYFDGKDPEAFSVPII